MRFSSIVRLVSVASFLFPVVAVAEDLKSADEVIARYIKAIGGRDKIDAVKTMRSTGKVTFGGGMEAPTTLEFKRPNRVRIEFTFQGMTGQQAFDGETGWFVMPFMGKPDPEKMAEDQVKAMKQQADIDGPLVDYKKKGHQVELVGKDEVEGTQTYKLKITRKDGDVEYHYIDAEYFVPIKVSGKREFQGTEIEYNIALGDYKPVNGLLMAHSIQQGGPNGMGSTITLEKVDMNLDLDDARFAMPKKAEGTPEDKSEKSDDEGEE